METATKRKLIWNADLARQRTGYRLYEECGHNFLGDHAGEQLASRCSHYYDKATRKGFGSTVTTLRIERGGLLLATIEGVNHPSEGRVYRAVVHDLAGNTIYRSFDRAGVNGPHGFKKSSQAEKDMNAWLHDYLDEPAEAKRIVQAEICVVQRTLKQLRGKE